MPVAPVSVVVPCYRCAGTIERAVRSVAQQSRRPAELILVDDGNADSTPAELERLRERYGADWIRIVRLARNAGAASARNAGWEAATHPYVAFLDSDDAWHPRKIEIQHAWMAAHPEVAVTGHGARQLAAEADIGADPGGGVARPVSRRALHASNQFITPSVMLRRELPQRFEAGKRYMEDYLLWLEIAAAGHGIARLPQILAYTFKAPFGEAGLSASPWKMEQGELAAFTTLFRKGHIGFATWVLLAIFSIIKFCRRLAMIAAGYSPAPGATRPSFLFPAAYLMLTQSMTALLIGAGLLGRSELAADIGIIQAATLATFFAFSGNARSLILTTRIRIPAANILAARLTLLLPLGAAALFLCVAAARADVLLALILVARRAVEWIAELALSENERRGDRAAAAAGLALQSVLLVAAVGVIAVAPEHTHWAILAWAIVPIFPALRFVTGSIGHGFASLRNAMRMLLPHFGSTAVTGASLYAFRALLVLIAGKAAAGDLFVAFAIGSFLGTIFANVLGPSISLHEERSGMVYLPRLLWLALLLQLAAGLAIAGAGMYAPAILKSTHLTPLFWQALGWSLLGGVVMLIAQRRRLRLLASEGGDVVFGADVLVHVLLVAAVPLLFAIGSDGRLSMLYAINAALALMFYGTSVRGIAVQFGTRIRETAGPVLAFLIFLPMFVFLSGALFHPALPVWDSGGALRTLPLPISILACFGGLLVLGRYDHAAPGLWAILGMLVAMVFSSIYLSGSETTERTKMLMMLQFLLPTFGLVLGAAMGTEGRHWPRIAGAIFAVVALIVPAQLLSSWMSGTLVLGHDVFLFGVYQHFQFVPVIIVCAFLVALPAVWAELGAGGKLAVVGLWMLLAMYAAAAVSLLAMFAVIAGAVVFAWMRFRTGSAAVAVAVSVAVLGSLVGYTMLARDTEPFQVKFGFLFPVREPPVVVSCCGPNTIQRFGSWTIDSKDEHGIHLIRIVPPRHRPQATLKIDGELRSGGLVVLQEKFAGTIREPRVSINRPGAFSVMLDVDIDRDDGFVVIVQEGPAVRAVIRKMQWSPPANVGAYTSPAVESAPYAAEVPHSFKPSSSSIPSAGSADMPVKSIDVPNVTERLSDWRLFGIGIGDSWQAFFFGHEKLMARTVRSSAHNYFLDLAYNFGTLALLPLIALIIHTIRQLWRQRRHVSGSEMLLMHALVVAFLVLVDSNFKVTLRQPYPGIAAFFLWGLLLARLKAQERERITDVTEGLHSARA